MSLETPVGMLDARDAEDARLLESGEHETLLATYLDTIVDRCRARIHGPEAEDVAQNVVLRLWDELERGRRYRVPFRVVVHMVATWKLKEHFGEQRFLDELEEIEDDGYDAYAAWMSERDLTTLFAGLPERQRQVAHLRYVVGLEHDQIAATLGINRNAVDQALHNAHRKLEGWLS